MGWSVAETTKGKKKKKKKARSAQDETAAPRKKKRKVARRKKYARPPPAAREEGESRAAMIVVVSIAAVLLLVVAAGLGALFLFKESQKTASYSRGSRAVVNYPPSVPFKDRYAKDEILVINPTEALEAASVDLGFRVIERVPLFGLALELLRLRIPSGAKVPKAQKMLARQFPRLTIEPNFHFETQAKTKGKVSKASRSLARAIIGWEKATSKCGVGLRIGMIDSPVDVAHPSLKGRSIEYRTFHDPQYREAPPTHGTAIASMLVGRPKWGGLMPGAELRAANMFGVTRRGMLIGSSDALVKAINWMALERVHVINISIAGARNELVKKAVDRARKKGVVAVAAAGNGGAGARPYFPAAYKNVIAVTAFDRKKIGFQAGEHGRLHRFRGGGGEDLYGHGRRYRRDAIRDLFRDALCFRPRRPADGSWPQKPANLAQDPSPRGGGSGSTGQGPDIRLGHDQHAARVPEVAADRIFSG